MKTLTRFLFLIWGITFLISCSDDDSDDNNPPLPGGPVTITGTSPEYTFWSKELTITGTGFSTNKDDNFVWFQGVGGLSSSCGTGGNDSSGWRKAEVVSVTATEMKVIVPFLPKDAGLFNTACGDNSSIVRITVNDRTAVSDQAKLLSLPIISGVCNSNSGYFGVALVPDHHEPSIMTLTIGLFGEISGYEQKLRLKVDGIDTEIEKRTDGCGNFNVRLPESLANAQCDSFDPYLTTLRARELPFVLHVDEENIESDVFNYYVASFPSMHPVPFVSISVSKTAPGFPTVKITGQNLNFYSLANFTNLSCGNTNTDVQSNLEGDELTIQVPLSMLSAGCMYQVALEGSCGQKSGNLGSVTITP